MIQNDIIIENKPIKFERHKRILDLLERNGFVKLKDLEQILKTKRLTIQRDLIELEENNLLDRVHGGAIKKGLQLASQNYETRVKTNLQMKSKIAKKAAEFINEGDTISMDGSTTAEQLVDYFNEIAITVLTHSMGLFKKLTKIEKVNTILTGGQYNKRTENLIGLFASQTINNISFNKCFFSANGFDPAKGSIDFDVEDNIIKNAMIEKSEKVYLLIDSTKIKNTMGILGCPIDKIDYIIIDDDHDLNWSNEIKQKIIIAK